MEVNPQNLRINSMHKRIIKHLKKLTVDWEKELEDPRESSKCHWDFGELLGSIWQGLITGKFGLRDIERETSLYDRRIPDTTLHDLIVEIDPEPLKKVLARQVKQALRSHELDKRELPINLTVVDGKSISTRSTPVDEYSGSWGKGVCVNMVLRALYASSKVKLLLGQMRIHGKTNENGSFELFFKELCELYGNTKLLQVFSLDAGFTSQKNAQLIKDNGCDYIMALKDPRSRPITQHAMDSLGELSIPELQTQEKSSGKLILRELFRVPIKDFKGWQHATELWRVKQTCTYKNKVTIEERFFVTSLKTSKLTNLEVLKTIRMHWSIENNANWVMDTVWQEDARPWCNRALELISLMRMIAYNFIARFCLTEKEKKLFGWKSLIQQFASVIAGTAYYHLSVLQN